MVLTFTCSTSVTQAGGGEVRQMLVNALGCNLAWGLIDAFMYLLSGFSEQGQAISAIQAVRRASSLSEARPFIENALSPMMTSLLSPDDFDFIRHRLERLRNVPQRPSVKLNDWMRALGVFLIVFLSTFPVAIPFMFIHEPKLALRISNAIAVALLFSTGYAFGRQAGYRPWLMGIGMIVLGSLLVAITIRLGG